MVCRLASRRELSLRSGLLQNLKELQVFLGIVGCSRQYLRDLATNARHLNQLTANAAEGKWSTEAQVKFDAMKSGLKTPSIPDPKHPYLLNTDASDVGVDASSPREGHCLLQKTLPQKNCCVTRKELLAVIKSV